MKIERILFPTDFSKYSESARKYAIHLCLKLDSKAFILHAIEPLSYEEADEEIKDFYKDLEEQLTDKIMKEKIQFDDSGIETHLNMVIGPSWKVINTFAKEKEIDLIVIGSHGLSYEEGDINLGTTSHKVMLTAPCPVLVVKNEASTINISS